MTEYINGTFWPRSPYIYIPLETHPWLFKHLKHFYYLFFTKGDNNSEADCIVRISVYTVGGLVTPTGLQELKRPPQSCLVSLLCWFPLCGLDVSHYFNQVYFFSCLCLYFLRVIVLEITYPKCRSTYRAK